MVSGERSLDVENMGRNLELLGDNPYPGRGIIIGNPSNSDAIVQVYWVMGRSEGSRNRILEVVDDVTVKTVPFDAEKETGDPELTQYEAMAAVDSRLYGRQHIVSNGRQTSLMAWDLREGSGMWEALAAHIYEPDAPNYTPRIAAVTGDGPEAWFAINSKDPVSDSPDHHLFVRDVVDDIPTGSGLCIHTYEDDAAPGEPLPAFTGNPYPVPVFESGEETADLIWDFLNDDNRVALAVKTISPFNGVNLVVRNALLGD